MTTTTDQQQPRADSRRERARQATIAEILDVARGQLAADEPVSLRKIAAEMGMTAPALYRYFPSASALTEVLAGEIVAEVRERITAAVDELLDRGRLTDRGWVPAPPVGDQTAAAWRVLRALAVDEPERLRLVLEHEPARTALLEPIDGLFAEWAREALAGAGAAR